MYLIFKKCLTREMTDLSLGQRSSGIKHFHKVRAVEQGLPLKRALPGFST